MPTLDKILSRVEDSIIISKSSLAVALNADILFNIYSYFKSEKEKCRLYISIDNLVKRTLTATGIKRGTTLNKVVLPRLAKQSGKATLSQSSMDTAVDTLALRPKVQRFGQVQSRCTSKNHLRLAQ